MTNNSKRFAFAKSDVLTLKGDEIIEEYKIEKIWEKIFVKQSVKTLKDPAGFIWSLIGNLIWMLILLIPAVAFMLKLLYIRRKRYYVEHLTFLFHFHAFIFFTGSIVVIIASTLNTFNFIPFIAIGIAIYLYAAMKRFYKQGWIKTFFKLCILIFSYGFLSIIFLTLMMIISLAIF